MIESDEHLAQFRAQSDKAFLAMQTQADEAMGKFLKTYSEGAALASFRTPDMSWNTAPAVFVQSMSAATTRGGRKVRNAVDKVDKMTGGKLSKLKGAAGHASHQAFNQFGELGESIKKDLNIHAEDAAGDVQNVLRSASMDLGERAKREAAAMREAARKAMTEETSLRGLAQRAKEELNAAKQRIKDELVDAQADALDQLEGVAVEEIGEIGEEGIGAAEQAGLQLEGLLGAPDSNLRKKKLR